MLDAADDRGEAVDLALVPPHSQPRRAQRGLEQADAFLVGPRVAEKDVIAVEHANHPREDLSPRPEAVIVVTDVCDAGFPCRPLCTRLRLGCCGLRKEVRIGDVGRRAELRSLEVADHR
jgi:hypothetical protein